MQVGDKLVVLGKNIRTPRAITAPSTSHSLRTAAAQPTSAPSQVETPPAPSVLCLSLRDDEGVAPAAAAAGPSVSQTHTAGESLASAV